MLNTVPSWNAQSAVLAQSFIKDETDRWCMPDRACQGDLQRLRVFGGVRPGQRAAEGFSHGGGAGQVQARLARAGLQPHRQGR